MEAFARDGEMITGGEQMITLGEKVPVGPAPHTDWARPLPGRPLRMVVISSTVYSFDVAEVQRRLDCSVRQIHLPDPYYGHKAHPEALDGFFSRAALKVLRPPADVILADPSVRFLNPAVAQAIVEKVEQGCGLVLLGVARWGGGLAYGYWPPAGNSEAWKQLGRRMASSVEGGVGKHHYLDAHSVTSPGGLFDGIPFDLLPAYHLVRMEPAAGVQVLAQDGKLPMVLGAPLGQGHVALVAWPTIMGCFPLVEDNRPAQIRQYQDYYAAAVIRLLLWAAGRPSPCELSIDKTTLAAGVGAGVEIRVRGKAAQIEIHLRDLLCRGLLRTTLSAATGSAAVKLPALAGGTYLLDAIARDDQGRSLGWASFALKAEAEGAVKIVLDREFYRPGQPLQVTALVEGVSTAGGTARLRLEDALGRLLMADEQPLAGNKAHWTYPNRDPLCVLHYAEVEVRRGGAPYLAARSEVFVPRLDFPDFCNCLWGGWLPDYAAARTDQRLREALGFDVILCGGYGGVNRASNFMHLASGAIPFYTNVAVVDPLRVEQAPLKTKADTLKMVDGTLDELRKFGGAAIFFQDERHGFKDSGQPTPEALSQFRSWLRGRYRDIGQLNAVWGRQFPGFDEVTPLLTKQFDPRQEPSLAPWLEWRQWAISAVVDIDRASAARVRQALGNDCWLGIEGIFGLAEHNIPYGGLDLAAQAEQCFNAAAPYGESLVNACQSFYRGPSFSWGGYSSPYSDYQRYVWAHALQGDWSLGWFCGRTYYSPYDWFFPQSRWVADLTRPLREGLGKLLLENRPLVHDPIAFLYSQSSLYSMAILGKTVSPENDHLFVRPADWARDSLQRMLFDSRVQFGYLSERQLQQGKAAGVKLLVLTSCVALAPETCRAIERFVADGGIVVADLCPGVWDARGGYHAPGQLDSLFGVTRDKHLAFAAMPADWSVGAFAAEPDFNPAGQWFIGQYFETTLKAAGGHALGKHIFGADQPPALVFQRTGKGATLLTNFLETEYRRVPEHSQRVLAEALLKLSGIAPAVTLRDRSRDGEIIDRGLKVTRWQDGPATYYGLLLDEGKDVAIEVPQAGHLYELSRGGRYLGQGAVASLDLRDAPYAVLAVLPYRVEKASLAAAPGRLGRELPLEFRLTVSVGQPVKHVVHLDVYRPDGSRYYSYSRNFAFRNGLWTGRLPLAINDPPGKWTLHARDVTSGVTAQCQVEVGP
jgi:hypothetical protein